MVLRAPFSLTPGSRMLDFLHQERGKALANPPEILVDPDVPCLRYGEAGITAGVDCRERGEVHVDVQRKAMVRPPLAHANAERRDLGAVHVDARRARTPLPAPVEQVDHCLLQKRYELLHLDAAAGKIDQGIDHELSGAVIGDVTPAIGLDQGNAVGGRPVLRALSQRVDRGMLEEPELIRGVFAPLRGEFAHRRQRGQVLDRVQALHDDRVDERHSTITTEGWSHSSRYSASSWSREVARTTQVTLRYLPWRLGRICTVAGSKSRACLRTISVTAWAKPRSFLPITLIGKSHGKASADSGTDGLALGGHRLPLSGAHHLLLELLVELVHAAEERSGPPVADRDSVERDDGQHFLGRRADPDLVGG